MKYFDIEFYLKQKPDKELLSALVEAVIDLGSAYSEKIGYWSVKSGNFVKHHPLEEAIEDISKYQGAICFSYKDIYYHLTFGNLGVLFKHFIVSGTEHWSEDALEGLWFIATAGVKEPETDYYVKELVKTIKQSRLGHIGIHISSRYLNPDCSKSVLEKSARNTEQFIEIAKAVWNAFEQKPIYGMGDYDIDNHPIKPTDDDILNLSVEPFTVYLMNFYGPELMGKFGREKLLSIPAYKVEELEDGIMFLRSPLSLCGDGMGSYEEICKHLGLKTYFVNVFHKNMLRVKEYFVHKKEFRDINTIKEYLTWI